LIARVFVSLKASDQHTHTHPDCTASYTVQLHVTLLKVENVCILNAHAEIKT